jgi:hypothetical protein
MTKLKKPSADSKTASSTTNSVALRVWGVDVDPEKISALLNWKPQISEIRKSRDGSRDYGVWDYTYDSLAGEDFDACVNRFLDWAETKREALQQIPAQFKSLYCAAFFQGWYTSWKFSPKTLQRMADMDLTFDVSAYPASDDLPPPDESDSII